MGIRRRIAKGVGYAVAPKLTFAAKRLKQAAKGEAASWVMSRVASRRHHRRRSHAMIGLGAAALAFPIGIWLGRRFRRDD